ncbi:hypothetical protein GYMLUDRAFT_49578 [Collybiopsis luxurians FD-317 M1]|uniref:Uncharacterized protein n=1 Tax=Collybiopsis luxurians FD-317 M1 TaxID=944289 RepID=A0A0D0ARP2_9AGAR|nr:hypothetical protein GYMLUDRAFT_49578 [Collybiopsis luxurians FD-317 M1]
MPPSRLGTVFDFSDLRLHSDGTLVLQTPKNTSLRASKRNLRNVRGNWIARDAGAVPSVPRYRKIVSSPEPEPEDDEGGDADGDDATGRDQDKIEEGSGPSGTGSAQSGKEPELRTSRARKRRKFLTNDDYLVPISSSPVHSGPQLGLQTHLSASPSDLSRQLDIPSSDLLKCIHHHASMYYHEQGLLVNASKQYREGRKARKLERLTQNGKNTRTKVKMKMKAQLGNSSSSEGADEDEDDEDEAEDEDVMNGDEESVSRADGDADNREKQTVEPRRFPIRKGDQDLADMYKTMDGSALMAIGILFQEHVAELLSDWPQSAAIDREDGEMLDSAG